MKMSQVIWKMIPDKVSASAAAFRILRSISDIRKKEDDVSDEDSSILNLQKIFLLNNLCETIFPKNFQKIKKNG